MSINEKLFKLQSQIGAISKDSSNPYYKSKYFDINGLIKHLQPILHDLNLLLIQPIEGGNVVSRIIDIETGDGYQSEMPLPSIDDPQKMGSAITYYRRYTLQSLLALQAEDDDGNLASKAKPTLVPDNERWGKAVHSVASGQYDIDFIKKNYTISAKNAERLVAEAMEMA